MIKGRSDVKKEEGWYSIITQLSRTVADIYIATTLYSYSHNAGQNIAQRIQMIKGRSEVKKDKFNPHPAL